jgi:hypothetical protein
MGSLLCRPALPSCENNCADRDERAIKHIHSQYASEHLPVAGIWCSRTSSGQTCNRRAQTRQTLIHMSKEQNQSPKEDQPHPHDHGSATLLRAPLYAHTICFPTATTVSPKWRWTVSNRRPPACKAGALPLSYTPRRNNRMKVLWFFLERKNFFLQKEAKTLIHTSQSLVGQGGVEPPTPRLSSVCSNQLSYWPNTSELTATRLYQMIETRTSHSARRGEGIC